eukprot:2018365-Pleurochrysis_carterae.AAC.1
MPRHGMPNCRAPQRRRARPCVPAPAPAHQPTVQDIPRLFPSWPHGFRLGYAALHLRVGLHA